MICKNCGNEIVNGEEFCPVCGAKADAVLVTENGTELQPPLVMSILSLVFSGLVGLILAIVAKNKMKAYVLAGGQIVGKAKAAKILSTLGLIFSIISIVSILLYIIAFAAVLSMA